MRKNAQLKDFGRLLCAEPTERFAIFNGLIDKLPLIEFCRQERLAALFYSFFSTQELNESFTTETGDLLSRTYQSEWARALRHDTIRSEINSTLGKQVDLPFVFVDPCLSLRNQTRNHFLSDRSITLLLLDPKDLEKATTALLQLGFRNSGGNNGERNGHYAHTKTNHRYVTLRRNEFIVRASCKFPFLFSEHVDYRGIFSRRIAVKFTGFEYFIPHSLDSMAINLLALNHAILWGRCDIEQIIACYLELNSNSVLFPLALPDGYVSLRNVIDGVAMLVAETLDTDTLSQLWDESEQSSAANAYKRLLSNQFLPRLLLRLCAVCASSPSRSPVGFFNSLVRCVDESR